ncbi:MAG: peptidoglycan DD-metalloendopeptidase family protein [Patescibacteria group bacterium]
MDNQNIRKQTLALLILVSSGVLIAGIRFSIAENQSEPAIRTEVFNLSDQVSEKKKRLEELQQKASEYQRAIDKKRKETATLETQLGILENRIAKTELDIEATKVEIEKTELEIQGIEAQIKEKEQEIARRKDQLAEFIRLIDRADRRSYLEVLLLNDSFSEFFQELKYLEDVEGGTADALRGVEEIHDALGRKKEEADAKRRSLASLNARLEEEKERIEEERAGKEALLSETRSSRESFQTLLARLRSEEQAADTDLRALESRLRSRLEESDQSFRSGDVILSWPVDPSRGITTYFHDPDYPFRYVYEHPGLDIRAKQGTAVRAPAPGYVARVRDAGMGYNYIMLIHNGGFSTVYGHLLRMIVAEDSFVDRGDIIGYSGGLPGTPGAGRLTTGPHLHFEVRLNGVPADPLQYLFQ